MQSRNSGSASDDAIRRLSENKSAIDSLSKTAEGRAAQEFAQKNEAALKGALQSGDTAEMGRLLSTFLSTKEGEKLAQELRGIIT